jgi:hypothetical protein
MNFFSLIAPLRRDKGGPYDPTRAIFKPCRVMDWETYCFVPVSGGAADKQTLKMARTHARAHVARISHPGARRNRKPIAIPDRTNCRTPRATNSAKSTRSRVNLTATARLQSVFQCKFCLIPYCGTCLRPAVNQPRDGTQHSNNISGSDVDKFDKTESARSISDDLDEDVGSFTQGGCIKGYSQKQSSVFFVCRRLGDSALDTFYRPAYALSRTEGQLLQYFFTRVPNEIFGSTQTPSSRALENMIYQGAADNKLSLLWTLIAMETSVCSFEPDEQARTMAILKRRSRAYRLMQARISDQKAATTNDFVLSVGVAAAAEHRMGNTQLARAHMRGLKLLLDARGGIAALQHLHFPSYLRIVVDVVIELGLPDPFTRQVLRKNLRCLRSTLREFCLFNVHVRTTQTSQNGGSWSLPSSHKLRHPEAFAHPALQDYIELPPSPMTDSQSRFYLAILYAMNKTLWHLRFNANATTVYLMTLLDAAQRSRPTGFVMQCFGSKLPSVPLLQIIGHHVAEMHSVGSECKEMLGDEALVEFVELVMLAGSELRGYVIQLMWSCLSCLSVHEITEMGPLRMNALIQEIEEHWLEGQLI